MGNQNPLAAAERRVAWLRVAAVGLIVAADSLPHEHGSRTTFRIIAAIFLAYALGALLWAHVGRVTRRASLAATAVDVVAISVLAYLSGGAYSEARFAYILIPIAVAFRFGWKITGLASLFVVAAYDAQAITDRVRHLHHSFMLVAVDTGYLFWIGVAATLFSGLLDRRTQDLAQLASGRRQLLADVMSAEDRERRILAENLHDHAIQNLLAARQDVEEAAAAESPAPDLERARESLGATLTDLRGAIFELHPHVLDQAGLETALRAIAERASRRGGFDVDLYLDHPHRHPDEALLLGAAREFLANAARHSKATKVTVSLSESDGTTILTTQDNGVGFDVNRVSHFIADAHIGLLSQRERLEAAGGQLEITSSPGVGTTVTATLPRRPAINDVGSANGHGATAA